MSNPAGNSDIEDVLSSIRRLVSDEPMTRRAVEPEPDAAVERLVLTPAFRVGADGDAAAAGETPDDGSTSDDAASGEAPDAPHAEDHQERLFDTSEEPAVDDVANYVETPLGDDHPAEEETPVVDASEAASIEFRHADRGTPKEPEDAEPIEDADDSLEVTDAKLPDAYEQHEEWSEPEAKSADDEAAEPDQAVEDPAHMSLEARIAELEAAIQQNPQEWEPDGSEDGNDDETRPLSADVSEVEHADNAEQSDDATTAEVDISSVISLAATSEQALSEEQHETTAELSDADQDVADAVSAEAEPEPIQDDLQTSPQLMEAEILHLSAMIADAAPAAQPAETSDVEAPNQPAELDIEIEAIEDVTASAEQSFDAEDTLPEVDPADVAAAWAHLDKADAPVDETPTMQAEETEQWRDFVPDGVEAPLAPAFDQTPDTLDTEEDLPTLDEEALRELVSELVREELQGVLGERITRNVRRLVRREIQRALAVRDLE